MAQDTSVDTADIESEVVRAAVVAASEGKYDAPALTALTAGDGADVLAICAIRDDVACVEALLRNGLDPDARTTSGMTPLIVAVSAGSLSAAQALLDGGADRHAETDSGSAVSLALVLGDPDAIRLLVEDRIERGTALLFATSAAGDVPGINEALAYGVEIDAKGPGDATPLHVALLSGHTDAVRALLDHGAHPGARDGDGILPLAVAILSGNRETVEAILAAGASPNAVSGNVRMLSLAAMTRQEAMVDALLAAGADPTLPDVSGALPAWAAAAAGHDDLAERLGGVPARNTATLAASVAAGNARAVEAALENGASPDQLDPAGNPVLLLAAASAQREIVRLLLRYDADLLATGEGGASSMHAALSIAEAADRTEIAGILLEKARDWGHAGQLLAIRDDDGRSAGVLLAARYGAGVSGVVKDQWPVVLPSLALGDGIMDAMANRPDADGVTPYAAALLSGNDFMLANYARNAAVEPSALPDGKTLQELARAKKAWTALFLLPDDRPMPPGLRKGAGRAVMTEMQQRLRDWGYYTGAADGVFGAGSQAAMQSFLKDRAGEMRAMAEALGGQNDGSVTFVRNSVPNAEHLVSSLAVRGRTRCTWRVVEWDPPNDTSSSRFVGCVEGTDAAWNANGVGLVEYNDKATALFLFGPGGWDDATPLR